MQSKIGAQFALHLSRFLFQREMLKNGILVTNKDESGVNHRLC